MLNMLNRSAAAALLFLALALVGGACSAGDKGGDPVEKTQPRTPEATETVVPLRAKSGKITGTLRPKERRREVASVGKVVDRWFEAAWLEVDRPGRNKLARWPGFTRDLAGRARRDRFVTSNARVLAKTDGTRAVRRSVKVDLLAAQGRSVGATARFRLVLDTSGSATRRVTVAGQLTLSPVKGTWRIFAYDVARTARAVPTRGKGS